MIISPRQVLFVTAQSQITNQMSALSQADLTTPVNIPTNVMVIEREQGRRVAEQR